MFTPKNFEYTNHCNVKYLVERKDVFLLIEFEATGSNNTYPLNYSFDGPLFYYTAKIHNNYIKYVNVSVK